MPSNDSEDTWTQNTIVAAKVSEAIQTLKRPSLVLLTDSPLRGDASKTCVANQHLAQSSPSDSSTSHHLVSKISEDSSATSLTKDRMRWRLASGYFAFFMCGWGDGVTGTVLPYFMADFHISFMMSSLLFAGSTLGFLIGTLLLETIVNGLGRFDLSKTQWSWIPKFFSKGHPTIGFSPSQARLLSLLISSVVHGIFFIMMGARGGFGGSFAAYSVAAFARAILTGSLNAYNAQVRKQSIGYAYGLWSVGGAISPIVCQAIIAMGVPWFKFYFGSLVLSAFNVTFLVLSFRPTPAEFQRDCRNALAEVTTDKVEKLWTQDTVSTVDELRDQTKLNVSGKHGAPKNCSSSALLWAIKLPYLWAIGMFAFLYCGAETSTQGFMVSYLLGSRHANPKTVGYVTSGFWAGISVGRFVWGYVMTRLNYTQRKYLVQLFLLIGLTMEIIIWKVDSNFGDSFATAIIGLAFGPVFPGCLALANDVLPPEVMMVSMGLISTASSFGSSLFSFIAGVISSVMGVRTLVYITVPLAGSLVCLWALFPSRRPSQR